jgi:hypothetical protein
VQQELPAIGIHTESENNETRPHAHGCKQPQPGKTGFRPVTARNRSPWEKKDRVERVCSFPQTFNRTITKLPSRKQKKQPAGPSSRYSRIRKARARAVNPWTTVGSQEHETREPAAAEVGRLEGWLVACHTLIDG